MNTLLHNSPLAGGRSFGA